LIASAVGIVCFTVVYLVDSSLKARFKYQRQNKDSNYHPNSSENVIYSINIIKKSSHVVRGRGNMTSKAESRHGKNTTHKAIARITSNLKTFIPNLQRTISNNYFINFVCRLLE
jgi:hypothetical protein